MYGWRLRGGLVRDHVHFARKNSVRSLALYRSLEVDRLTSADVQLLASHNDNLLALK